MDTQILVTEEDLWAIRDFANCLHGSDKLGLVLVSLVWDDDCQLWKLFVASNLHKKAGPLAAYEELDICLKRLEYSSIRLDQIYSLPHTDPLVVAIRNIFPGGIEYSIYEPNNQTYKRASDLRFGSTRISKAVIFYAKELPQIEIA